MAQNLKSTTDLWFASFLRLRGYSVENFDILSPHKGRWYFEIGEADWKELKLDYIKSETVRLRQFQEELKDLLY